MAKEIDKPLDDIIANEVASEQLVDEDGSIDIPGTPILLPGRGITPNEDEYIDMASPTGVAVDKDRIDYLKVKNSKDVIENQLLGAFDTQGIYSLNKNITKELMEIIKVSTTQTKPENKFIVVDDEQIPYISNIIYCDSMSDFSGFGKFKFAIQTYFDSKSATSELFLLEDIKKAQGFSSSVNIYSVGKFKANYSKDYKREMLQFFNVVSKETALKLSEEEKLLFGWAYRRKLYFKNIQMFGETKYLLAEANYLAAKLEMLSTMGAYGTTIISSFNSLKEKAAKIIGKELNARDLNDLLDLVKDQFSEKYPELTKQFDSQLAGATREFREQITLITETNSEKAKAIVRKVGSSSSTEWKYAKSRKINNKFSIPSVPIGTPKRPKKVEVEKVVSLTPTKNDKKEKSTELKPDDLLKKFMSKRHRAPNKLLNENQQINSVIDAGINPKKVLKYTKPQESSR